MARRAVANVVYTESAMWVINYHDKKATPFENNEQQMGNNGNRKNITF